MQRTTTNGVPMAARWLVRVTTASACRFHARPLPAAAQGLDLQRPDLHCHRQLGRNICRLKPRCFDGRLQACSERACIDLTRQALRQSLRVSTSTSHHVGLPAEHVPLCGAQWRLNSPPAVGGSTCLQRALSEALPCLCRHHERLLPAGGLQAHPGSDCPAPAQRAQLLAAHLQVAAAARVHGQKRARPHGHRAAEQPEGVHAAADVRVHRQPRKGPGDQRSQQVLTPSRLLSLPPVGLLSLPPVPGSCPGSCPCLLSFPAPIPANVRNRCELPPASCPCHLAHVVNTKDHSRHAEFLYLRSNKQFVC